MKKRKTRVLPVLPLMMEMPPGVHAGKANNTDETAPLRAEAGDSHLYIQVIRDLVLFLD